MSKIKQQLLCLAVGAVALVCVMQGSMVRAANPQNVQNQDHFIGFQVVVGERNLDRSNWVEYGAADQVALDGFGTFALPNEVLFAEYDPATAEWIFPGVPGNNAFYTTCLDPERDVTSGYAGMHANVNINFSSVLPASAELIADAAIMETETDDAQTDAAAADTATDTGETAAATDTVLDAATILGEPEIEEGGRLHRDTLDSISLSGTVYLPATKGDVFVTFYRVYETPDGRIYMDGSGNSSCGAGDSGGFGMSSTEEETVTINGTETYTVTTEIQVDIEFVNPCTAITLLEYNAQNECIASSELAAKTQTVTLQPDATWCVVQEIDAAGQQRQTALNKVDMWEDDRTLYHGFVIETGDGVIQANHLNIKVP